MTILSATGHRPDKPYVYLAVADQLRANGERHLANAIGYASQSNFQYSDGSMRKALRHFKRADEIDNFFNWRHSEYSVSLGDVPKEMETLLHERVNAAYKNTADAMAQMLYSDSPQIQRLIRRRRFRDFLDRAHNAWLVLTGRADIY